MITNCPHCKAEVSDRGEQWTAFKCGSVLSNNHLQIVDMCRERASRTFQAGLRMKAEADIKSLEESLATAQSEVASLKTILANVLPYLEQCRHSRQYPPCDLEKIGSPGKPYRRCTCGLDNVTESVKKIVGVV